MTESAYQIFVGIDWGSQTHQVVVLDAARRVVGDRVVAHDGLALHTLAQWVAGLAPPGAVAVAIEVPHGAVVDTLLEHGLHVYALNPRQMDRFRDRYTVAGAKDDRRDAQVLAAALLTDQPAFRRLQPDDPLIVQLREHTRMAAEVQEDIRRLANRLREQLLRFYPQALALCPAADEPWFWALLRLLPTPAAAARRRRDPVVTLLREHRIRRVTADEVLTALRRPPLTVAPGTIEAAGAHIALLLPRLELAAAQRRACAAQLDTLLATLAAAGEQRGHRDVTILRSFPGVGRTVAATMLAEAAQLLASRDYHRLRAYGGAAPVTHQSGTRRSVHMRYACNQQLRTGLYYWAFMAARHDPATRQHYAALRASGQSQGRALRGVVDRLLAVLIAMLRTQTLYDAGRRQTRAAA
ncbi:MAG TPA: IS110 family transposase [Opitutaceae bacterium]|nr:IS110 family transposase [Opitutaceae bacterium]